MKLILRQDGACKGCSMPIQWIDDKEEHYLASSDTMELEIAFHSESELTEDGFNIILLVTDPEKGWDGREAFGVSADYDYIEEVVTPTPVEDLKDNEYIYCCCCEAVIQLGDDFRYDKNYNGYCDNGECIDGIATHGTCLEDCWFE